MNLLHPSWRRRAGTLLLLLLGSCWAGWASAAPLHEEQGGAETGVAGSATARVMGPATVFSNPAGMAWLRGISVEIGGAAAVPYAEATTGSSVVGSGVTRVQPTLATPPAVFAVATQ